MEIDTSSCRLFLETTIVWTQGPALSGARQIPAPGLRKKGCSRVIRAKCDEWKLAHSLKQKQLVKLIWRDFASIQLKVPQTLLVSVALDRVRTVSTKWGLTGLTTEY